ncbi:ABC transporter permease subunit [Nesterenkonia pannonica]|uniref:ABC transporter permease n=1 Tax=Nesterenkonia pannonica TaxID=1548602 RepID=UPI002164C032|nr:ABC transporter permease subunit [Nesterenkonia pannonica]
MNSRSYSPATSLLLQAWLPVSLIVLWFLLSASSTSAFWPPLTEILSAMGDWALSGELWNDAVYSFTNYFLALFLSLLVGLGFGIAIGLMPKVGRVLDPFLDFLRSLPVVVFVPIIILSLGIGREPKVFLIFLACVWPILLNAIVGVRSIHAGIFEASDAYRIPLRLRIPKVVLVGALPQIVVGVRLAITIGIVMLVVSEMYGATEGIGYFILQSAQRFQLSSAWA